MANSASFSTVFGAHNNVAQHGAPWSPAAPWETHWIGEIMILSDFMHFVHLFHLISKIRKTPEMRKSIVINGIRIITICKTNVKNEQNDFE